MSAGDRRDILKEAEGYVTKDRNTSYGEPEDNFKAIAEVWNAQGFCVGGIDGVRPINATDVALMMAGMKLARLKHNPSHRDSWVDLIGYAACGWDTAKLDEDVAAEKLADLPKLPVKPSPGTPRLVSINDRGEPTLPKTLAELNAAVSRDFDSGWVSDNRCGNYISHPPHEYSSGSRGFDSLHGYLRCDGYDMSRVPKDVSENISKAFNGSAVKVTTEDLNVGKQPHQYDCCTRAFATNGAGHSASCDVASVQRIDKKLRPIKDNPQA